MIDEDQEAVRIVTVPARLGETYAVWLTEKNMIIVAADTWEQQLTAIMELVDHLLERSAAMARRPVRSD